MEWGCKAFHVGLEPQPLHESIIWRQAVTQDGFWLVSQILTDKYCGNVMMMMMGPYPHPQHMIMMVVNHLSYVLSMEWVLEAFHVSLEPKSMHVGYIPVSSLRNTTDFIVAGSCI
jgi:hypothetical protein